MVADAPASLQDGNTTTVLWEVGTVSMSCWAGEVVAGVAAPSWPAVQKAVEVEIGVERYCAVAVVAMRVLHQRPQW